MRDFNIWLGSFRDSIASYDYFVDFPKVYKNAEQLKVELHILNSLIGSKNIKSDFINLLHRYPEILKAIPVLLAKREMEIKCMDTLGSQYYDFRMKNFNADSIKALEKIAYFMERTGLFTLLAEQKIQNLLDYVTGVEVGLDSNGRKNRGGHLMENLVEGFLQKAGLVHNKTYFKEMYLHTICERWHLDLSALSNHGKAEKRFDFVIAKGNQVYGLEINFYNSSGNKLNETARSYKTLALESQNVDGFTFVWITDGEGWRHAHNNLQETFEVLPCLFNITDLENGAINKLLNEV